MTQAAELMPEKAGFDRQRLSRISTMLRGYVERGELPGVSAAISRAGITSFYEKFGWQDIAAEKPLEFDTLFRIMSMTKPVTAVAAMLLYEEGHFDLNTPICDFLPAFTKMRVFTGADTYGEVQTEDAAIPITFRHLFTHTSGLSYGSMPNDPVDQLYQDTFTQTERRAETILSFAEELAQHPLAFQPGTQWRYGYNLDILGALVEVLSGMDLAEFMQKRIFVPLNMVDTAFDVPVSKQDRLAIVYRRHPKRDVLVKRTSPVPMPVKMWGGGGLVSTLGDYSHFAEMLANHGAYGGVQLLSPSTVEMFSTNWAAPQALPSFHAADPRINGGYGLSLGTAVLMDPSPTGKFGNVGEFYWGGAFSTYFWIDPQESLYGVLMTQLDPVWAYPTPWQFKQLTYQALV
ncbi:MAG: serine hydrolase [Anaerolineae bacterium]|nr:serine hydrolase [Anaerolineae bacterium]